MELIVHQSISDLYQSLDLPVTQDLEFTVHSLSEIHDALPFRSPIFRADYFSFVFVKCGQGAYTLDEQEFKFQERTLYFTNPGHIKSFFIEACDDAYIVTLTESFLRENVHPDIFGEFPFLLAETVPPIQLSEADFSEFETLYLQLYREFNQLSHFKSKILSSLFVVLLLKIKEQFWNTYDPIAEGDGNSRIVRAFQQRLEEHFTGLTELGHEHVWQVQDYAHDLHLHPNYFTQVIKAKTGRSAHQWIADRMVSSAKALLKSTDLSAKEIGFRLGFAEATHFSRFFKKQAGLTPGAYRRSH
ncbi:MAG: helix-turn-helix domain-containing protein [Salibacteraceae bacterium]